jgi:hypothetical protein
MVIVIVIFGFWIIQTDYEEDNDNPQQSETLIIFLVVKLSGELWKKLYLYIYFELYEEIHILLTNFSVIFGHTAS